jgi:hypothetical protein
MIKNWILAAFAALTILPATLKADEGMWLPMFLGKNMEEMQKMGLQLTPEQLYDINNSSLKDAIVSFGGFCTGEIISSKGLILTNHHCGYEAIQSHSVEEKGKPELNILKNGFWAKDYSQEKPNEGLFVDFLVRMDDVSTTILEGIDENTPKDQRDKLIGERIENLSAEKSEQGKYIVNIKSFYNGNEYYMFTYQRYDDVRLVGTPPESIGKYGGDTDNWMWPRQTGDFSMFRVYTAPDGSPAHYSKDNVPMAPKHHLPISMKGVKPGDFSMIWGYPGSTDRYLTSYGIKQNLEERNPSFIDIRRLKLDVLDKHMAASPTVRLQYASKYANVANYWKNYIGMSKALVKLNIYGEKKAIEDKFTTWVNQEENRKAHYGEALSLIENSYKETNPFIKSSIYVREAALTGADIVLHALRTSRTLEYALKPDNADKKKFILEAVKESAKAFYKDYNMETDKDVFVQLMTKYNTDISDAAMKPTFFKKVKKGNFKKWANKAYKKSIFTDKKRMEEFLKNPTLKVLEKDPMYMVQESVFGLYEELGKKQAAALATGDKGKRLFIDGLRKMNPNKNYYPDANFTMRCTYGKVGAYQPRDGVKYKYFTTMEGIMEKMDNETVGSEFVVPEKMISLYNAKDYGRYADKDGELHVCFISDNDITGGNSGSPVINGKGELIGCAFDGNWEAMSGDIDFEEKMQRTISVDIRYVLWVIDKFSGAKHIVDEMTLVYE